MPFLLLMPSYNQAHYIGEAIRSILAQDDPDWELWIVDNSTDRTDKVVAELADPRIRFHQLPGRMDPGSCLNWALHRAQGRDFSYVHTDNNLAPSYVRRMREALARDELSLAYCDLRLINQHGAFLRVQRRGEYDLARLLSLCPLGVPFAATTALARRIGGFSADDVADDVGFCAMAYGVAHYVYVRAPLLDYRVHAGSRTEAIGGVGPMVESFLRTHARVVPALEARGLRPLQALDQAVREMLDDVELFVEDCWYRYLGRRGEGWRGGRVGLEELFRAGLLQLPCNTAQGRVWLRAEERAAALAVPPDRWLAFLHWRHKVRQELKRRVPGLSDLVVPWAYLHRSVGHSRPAPISESLPARAQWIASMISHALGTEALEPKEALLESEGVSRQIG